MSFIQRIPPGLLFHPFVQTQEYPGVMFKYGVVTRESVKGDLVGWNHLYLAGRLQKPVRDFVVTETHPNKVTTIYSESGEIPSDIKDAMSCNFLQAAAAAVITSPVTFSETEVDLF